MTRRILLVDDEHNLRLTIAANLELEGWEVVEASSGPEALALVEEGPFDVVLSDIRMPGMNGVELFRELRRRYPSLPVLLMTAFALEGLVAEALREGVWTLLPKPFEIDHLVAALSLAANGPAVLIVDDAEPLAVATAAALCAVGVRAEAVADGARAIELVRAGHVDVCVVDMVMPGLSGPEVIERIRALDRSVTCIAVSGHDVQELFRRAATHVHTFLRKPVDPPGLAETIARARGVRRRT